MEIKFNHDTGEIIKFCKTGGWWSMDDHAGPYKVQPVDDKRIPEGIINTKKIERDYLFLDGMFVRKSN